MTHFLLKTVLRDLKDYAKLRHPATNSWQTNSPNFKKTNKQTNKQTNSIESTYSNFPSHLKVNGNTRQMINRLIKCKEGERLTITTNSFTKINRHNGFLPLWRSAWENPARSRNQSDCRIYSVNSARSRAEKNTKRYKYLISSWIICSDQHKKACVYDGI